MKTGAILDSCFLLVIKLNHWKLFSYLLYEGKPPTFAKWCHASEGGILFVCLSTHIQAAELQMGRSDNCPG